MTADQWRAAPAFLALVRGESLAETEVSIENASHEGVKPADIIFARQSDLAPEDVRAPRAAAVAYKLLLVLRSPNAAPSPSTASSAPNAGPAAMTARETR